MLLAAFHHSFEFLPAGKLANFISNDFAVQTFALGSSLWLTALKLAIPVILLIFIVDFTFGIVSRVAPQVNVFMLGFQVKPYVGLFGIMLMTPLLIKYLGKVIELMLAESTKFLMYIK